MRVLNGGREILTVAKNRTKSEESSARRMIRRREDEAVVVVNFYHRCDHIDFEATKLIIKRKE